MKENDLITGTFSVWQFHPTQVNKDCWFYLFYVCWRLFHLILLGYHKIVKVKWTKSRMKSNELTPVNGICKWGNMQEKRSKESWRSLW